MLEDYKRMARQAKDLDELFSIWEKAHLADENVNNNKPQGINRENFVRDGIISAGNSVEVLFILKEANIKEYNNSSHSQVGFYTDWIETSKGLNSTKQQLKMGLMAYYYLNRVDITNKKNNKEAEGVAKEGLKKSAFMNLNKRGGSNQTNRKILDNYIKDYEDFINREIELISPKKVIILGNVTLNYTNSIKMWHPAYAMPGVERSREPQYTEDKNVDAYIKEFIERIS